ncbi:hypothetical protein M8013_06120 [Enterobacteriaceae bacterium H4N4]|uniref:Uncharacterized protein n=1 Tax=Silvania confinis TaxID=2926470 RepID=A0A9J6QDL0_9ENTR|nr:hypothetical protein [Silvania confinis]MCU6668331.1 hypothetical protein [Silvania confinis]
MMQFLKKWVKEQLSFCLRGGIPLLIVIVFSLLAVSYLPENIAIKAIGLFIIAVGIAIFCIKQR